MSSDLNPAQRLAISRARLVDALRDPLWLILLQRGLQAKARSHARSHAASPSHKQAPDGHRRQP
jgi:hypothetical protein